MSDKHGAMTKQELEKTHGFEQYYNEYAKKYVIEN